MNFALRKREFGRSAERVIFSDDMGNFPHLHNLCDDFGFAVFALKDSTNSPKRYSLCEVDLASNNGGQHKSVSPSFADLSELERFASEHTHNIVQKYLFGDNDLDDL